MLKSRLFEALEGCESGLIGSLGKRRVAKAARGFEPLSLRQKYLPNFTKQAQKNALKHTKLVRIKAFGVFQVRPVK